MLPLTKERVNLNRGRRWGLAARGGSFETRRDLCESLRAAAAIAVPVDRHNLGVVREAIDEGDAAGRIGKDGVPLLDGKVVVARIDFGS